MDNHQWTFFGPLIFCAGMFTATSCAGVKVPPSKVLQVTTQACVDLADAYQRPDIALLCETSNNLAPLIDQLLGEAAKKGCENEQVEK